MVHGQVEEPGQLLLLPFHIRVEQGFVALPAAPEDVVGPAQLLGGGDGVLDLEGGVGEHRRVRVGGRAVGVAGMAEQVGRAPQELDPGLLLQLSREGGHLLQVGHGFGRGLALGGQVAVVEAVEPHPQLGEELEGGPSLGLGPLQGRSGLVPGPLKDVLAKGVQPGVTEGVPVGHREPKVLGHALGPHHPPGVVILEGQGVGGAGSLKGDGVFDLREIFGHGTPRQLRGGCPPYSALESLSFAGAGRFPGFR